MQIPKHTCWKLRLRPGGSCKACTIVRSMRRLSEKDPQFVSKEGDNFVLVSWQPIHELKLWSKP